MTIKIARIYAFPTENDTSDEMLEREMNKLNASRIISVDFIGDYQYKIIYEA